MKLYLYTGLLTFAAAIWVVLEAELADLSAITVCIFVVVAGIARFVREYSKRRAWAVLSASSVVSLAGMFVALYITRADADAFARSLIEDSSWRPSYAELQSLSPGWIRDSAHLEKRIERFGATRLLTYQENGLFRYGFLYDETRAVWLPQCDSGQSPK